MTPTDVLVADLMHIVNLLFLLLVTLTICDAAWQITKVIVEGKEAIARLKYGKEQEEESK